jgi:hypothetical protein
MAGLSECYPLHCDVCAMTVNKLGNVYNVRVLGHSLFYSLKIA